MAKILRYKTPKDDIVEALQTLLEKAKQGEITSFIFAAKCTDGNVATSWAEADVGTRQELNSHLQVDINFSVVEANVDRIIEWI